MNQHREQILQYSSEAELFIDRFLTATCDTSRRHILALLSGLGENTTMPVELPTGEIAQLLGLAPSTTSEHLKQLRSMHLLQVRRSGKNMYYCIRNQELVQTFQDLIHSLETHYRRNLLPPPSNP